MMEFHFLIIKKFNFMRERCFFTSLRPSAISYTLRKMIDKSRIDYLTRGFCTMWSFVSALKRNPAFLAPP